MKSTGNHGFRRAVARTQALAVALGLTLSVAVSATAATYVWNGAGVDGGTGTNRWEDAGNWLVGGDVPATPPGADDDVTITFNATNIVPAVRLPDGAQARHVTLGGTTTAPADNRFLLFTGNAGFATFNYLGAVNTYAFTIAEGYALTLSGGDESTPTFQHHRNTNIHNHQTIRSAGVVMVTANPAYFQLGLTATGDREPLANVDFRFPQPVSLDFDNRPGGLHSGGRLLFDVLPVAISNPPPDFRLRENARIVGPSGQKVDFSETLVQLTDRSDTGVLGNVLLRALRVASHASTAGNVRLTAIGDIGVAGHAIINPGAAYGHMVTGAVYVSRLERTSGLGDGAFLEMDGYDLTVTSAYPVIVGDMETPGNNIHASVPRSVLDLRGSDGRTSTLDAAGGLWVGYNGAIAAEADVLLRIGADFFIKTHMNHHLDGGHGGRLAGFNLVDSTVIMNGTASRSRPQRLEVHGEDLGATLGGQVASNLAFGRLQVGTPEQATHARLVDLADFKEDGLPDALYVGELEVHAGSTLDLHGFNLYVNGVSAWGNWRGFGDGMVIDSTLPSGTLMMLR